MPCSGKYLSLSKNCELLSGKIKRLVESGVVTCFDPGGDRCLSARAFDLLVIAHLQVLVDQHNVCTDPVANTEGDRENGQCSTV